jgi:hypothetical protein
MPASAKPALIIVVKCLSILAFIGAFIALMRWQEDAGKIDKLKQFGLVSMAEIVDKQEDEILRQTSGIGRRSSGGTSRSKVYRLNVRFDPTSTVTYADFDTQKTMRENLPGASANSSDANSLGIMWVSFERFERSAIGSRLPVAIVPWDKSPVAVEDIRSFNAKPFYNWLAGLTALGIALWLLARRIAKHA